MTVHRSRKAPRLANSIGVEGQILEVGFLFQDVGHLFFLDTILDDGSDLPVCRKRLKVAVLDLFGDFVWAVDDFFVDAVEAVLPVEQGTVEDEGGLGLFAEDGVVDDGDEVADRFTGGADITQHRFLLLPDDDRLLLLTTFVADRLRDELFHIRPGE